MRHLIDVPSPEDAAAIGRMQLAAWLETYPHPATGIDESWIRTQRGDLVSPEGVARWREFLVLAAAEPQRAHCRVVRQASGGAIVGVLCGLRERPGSASDQQTAADQRVTLGPMYLRTAAQGLGLGRQLMTGFLAWAQPEPIQLWVAGYNEQAIRFYRRHGFRLTGERELWRERMPNLRMRRAPGALQD